MNIDIIAMGNLKESFYKNAVNEYKKRISRYSGIDIIELKEEKLPKNESDKDIENALIKESLLIKSKIKDRSFKIALDICGKKMDSIEFSKLIEKGSISGGSNISFIIGSSYGLDESLKKECDFRLSISDMTFSHIITRIILLEQIFRAFKIINNETYHK